MRKKFVILVLVMALLLLTAAVVEAITYGEPDGDGHPFVGILLADFGEDNGGIDGICSGTLIAPDVFLTAGHCTAYLESLDIHQVFVSFDPEFDLNRSRLYGGTYVTHPGFGGSFADFNDLAVVLLDRRIPPQKIAPAELPPAGFLDGQDLSGQTFTAVGYGVTAPEIGGGPPIFDGFGLRRVSVSSFSALNDQWLRLSQNDATGDAGTCFGDSGGPNFFGAGAEETKIIAGVTSTGDAMCLATNTTYRVDTPEARAFLGEYVQLP